MYIKMWKTKPWKAFASDFKHPKYDGHRAKYIRKELGKTETKQKPGLIFFNLTFIILLVLGSMIFWTVKSMYWVIRLWVPWPRGSKMYFMDTWIPDTPECLPYSICWMCSVAKSCPNSMDCGPSGSDSVNGIS